MCSVEFLHRNRELFFVLKQSNVASEAHIWLTAEIYLRNSPCETEFNNLVKMCRYYD